jgi:hypothetical protein
MKITHEPQDKDAWVCTCGNTPSDSGFYPCDDKGQEVEPIKGGTWDEKSYVCHQCGAIIDQDTLEITGHKEKI